MSANSGTMPQIAIAGYSGSYSGRFKTSATSRASSFPAAALQLAEPPTMAAPAGRGRIVALPVGPGRRVPPVRSAADAVIPGRRKRGDPHVPPPIPLGHGVKPPHMDEQHTSRNSSFYGVWNFMIEHTTSMTKIPCLL